MKLLRAASGDPAALDLLWLRLVREARALARLQHSNAVAVYDVGTLHAQVWLAMEFVVGKTLDAWREAVDPSWKQVLEVIKQAARHDVVSVSTRSGELEEVFLSYYAGTHDAA